MVPLCAVLVARDVVLIEFVKGITDALGHVQLETCASLAAARPHLCRSDLFLLVIHLPGDNGTAELIPFLRDGERTARCSTIVVNDNYPKRELDMLRQAGAECLRFPYDWVQLTSQVESLARDARADARAEEAPSPSADVKRPASWGALGQDPFFYVLDPEMVELMEQVRRVAPQDTTLLFTGETGTGKTRLARLVHELSSRRSEPFLVMDCGALSASLIESEMFGHVRGAFTGADRDRPGKLAAAGRGTLLLDEINALPIALQSKLLRAVDDRLFEPVGSNKVQQLQARLIAISNTSLETDVKAGRFRADLYYRLNVVSFFLSPLRERRGIIAPLATKFLNEYAARNRTDIHGVTPEALQALENYDWPGNLRELRNTVERAVALSPGPEIELKDLPEELRSSPTRLQPLEDSPSYSSPFSLSQTREKVEVQRIVQALRKHKNNRLRAAAELGISRMGLYKKLRKYGLMDPRPLVRNQMGSRHERSIP
jgi:DNA-binding NtrC family response regulator